MYKEMRYPKNWNGKYNKTKMENMKCQKNICAHFLFSSSAFRSEPAVGIKEKSNIQI